MQTQLSIASKINELYTQAELFSKQAKDTASQAISLAVECGRLLNDQKKAVGHGAWLGWLKENCPNISERTAQKYMRLSRKVCELEDSSKTNADSDLPIVSSENVSKLLDGSPKTLTQAYIAAGVIPEPKKPETNAGVTDTGNKHLKEYSSRQLGNPKKHILPKFLPHRQKSRKICSCATFSRNTAEMELISSG